jgi:hypothetical protein
VTISRRVGIAASRVAVIAAGGSVACAICRFIAPDAWSAALRPVSIGLFAVVAASTLIVSWALWRYARSRAQEGRESSS